MFRSTGISLGPGALGNRKETFPFPWGGYPGRLKSWVMGDIPPLQVEVDCLPENQTGTGTQNREKGRDTFLTSQLKSKDPAMPEVGTSPGLLL